MGVLAKDQVAWQVNLIKWISETVWRGEVSSINRQIIPDINDTLCEEGWSNIDSALRFKQLIGVCCVWSDTVLYSMA